LPVLVTLGLSLGSEAPVGDEAGTGLCPNDVTDASNVAARKAVSNREVFMTPILFPAPNNVKPLKG
jgi:hypothetical protein